ncbi:hypothetical protein [Halosimplex pelagicum]|uniref:Uncharacterized protein n=1 Tax=Halosimplex pelagicum TaxID=869886 RepID=A0A7D5TCP7_9EURY|nr:hypothetical protein [Halosimplex pelagicum]QLH84810.1 hypothetical protein HZS54_25685 [Halosimplex pelagicum]
MEQPDVNSMILERVDDLEDEDLRRFINEILRFERSKMDREHPHFKDEYNDLIDKYAVDSE